MKLLTVAIPCYNSEAYMSHAIETLLTGGEEVEIIIVNDGSKDRTKEIADAYVAQYPDRIKAIHQENGGHGEAVNTGLLHATGLYYKVVDSDDWVNEAALQRILKVIRYYKKKDKTVDMFLANYVYERVHEGKQRVVNYSKAFPQNKIFSWDSLGHLRQDQFILMHSVIYRTQLLKDCGVKLPKHTFYVDNIFVYTPLPYVKTMVYLNEDFYRYFIGREDQSVNETVMMGRMDQQLRVTKQMIAQTKIGSITDKKLKRYMIKYMTIMMTICTVFLLKKGQPEDKEQLEDIWDYMKQEDIEMYQLVRKTLLGQAMRARSNKLGSKIILLGYKISRKVIGFS
ncbi:MAG: glycosyltransferase family 2 protein [bacterium]|nr:glycosyltransferase family 2 protein [bacterium]